MFAREDVREVLDVPVARDEIPQFEEDLVYYPTMEEFAVMFHRLSNLDISLCLRLWREFSPPSDLGTLWSMWTVLPVIREGNSSPHKGQILVLC